MMTNAEIIYQGAKFVMTSAAAKGAKIIIDGFVTQFTPEDLKNSERIAVEIAKWGGATAFGAVCAGAVESKLEKGKAYFEFAKKFVKSVEEGKKSAEPVIEVAADINPVEIVEEEEVEEDFLQ